MNSAILRNNADLKLDHRVISRTGSEMVRDDMDDKDRYWFWLKFQGIIQLDSTIVSNTRRRDSETLPMSRMPVANNDAMVTRNTVSLCHCIT